MCGGRGSVVAILILVKEWISFDLWKCSAKDKKVKSDAEILISSFKSEGGRDHQKT